MSTDFLNALENVKVNFLETLPEHLQVQLIEIENNFKKDLSCFETFKAEFKDANLTRFADYQQTKYIVNDMYRSLERSIEDSKNYFVSNVFESINSHFGTKIYGVSEVVEKTTNLNLDTVLDFIYKQVPDLKSTGENLVKEAFINCITDYKDNPKYSIKKNKLIIDEFVYYDVYSWRGPELSWDYKKSSLYKFQKAVELFFDDITRFDNFCHEIYNNNRKVTFREKYESVIAGKKFTFEFFKNRRFDVTFESEQMLRDFINFVFSK